MTNDKKKMKLIKKIIEAWSYLLEEDNACMESIEIPDKEYVKSLLLSKAQEGKSSEIKEILYSFHVEKLSDLEEKHYDELIQRVKNI